MNTDQSDGVFGSLMSYLAVYCGYAIQYIDQLDWTYIGAAVLLVARLVHDVPKAIEYLYGLYKRAREYVKRRR